MKILTCSTDLSAVASVNDFLLPDEPWGVNPNLGGHIKQVNQMQVKLRRLMNYRWDSTKQRKDQMVRPMFPMQQQPESREPFIRYVVTKNPGHPDAWWFLTDEVTYAIYDFDSDRSYKIASVIQQLLSRFDESAADVNRFVNRASYIARGNEKLPEEDNFNRWPIIYNSIYFSGGSSPEPPTQEGGRHVRPMSFAVDYVRCGIGLL